MLIHGDCLHELQKLPDQSVDLLCTDPPYGNNTAYGYKHNRTILGDEHPMHGLIALYLAYRVLKPNTTAYYFLDIKHLPITRHFVEEYTDYRIKDWIVWDKMLMGMGFGYRKRHELIAVLEKGKPVYTSLGFPNVLNVKREATPEHPHKKPLELIKALILQATKGGDTVLDPFVGSGTTAVAAKKLHRHFIGMEKDRAYYEIAKLRVEMGE